MQAAFPDSIFFMKITPSENRDQSKQDNLDHNLTLTRIGVFRFECFLLLLLRLLLNKHC